MDKNTAANTATNTGTVIDDKPSIMDHVVVVGAADSFANLKSALTSDTAKEMAKDAARGAAWGLGLGVGIFIADKLIN